MDSDAVISKQYSNTSFLSLLSLMARHLDWNPNEKPMIFNQVSEGGRHDSPHSRRMAHVGGVILSSERGIRCV